MTLEEQDSTVTDLEDLIVKMSLTVWILGIIYCLVIERNTVRRLLQRILPVDT